ncbi:MAG: hypothetical protein SOH65_08710 [Bifidobacterium sp.]|jgi:hypothetical protein
MEKQSLKELEEALTVMQETNDSSSPYAHSYIDSLLTLIHRYGDGEEDLEEVFKWFALDTVSLLQFFDTRLTVLESGKPSPKW